MSLKLVRVNKVNFDNKKLALAITCLLIFDFAFRKLFNQQVNLI